jgi:hypothetical protein
MSEPFNWHRFYGMMWTDWLRSTTHRIETERDTSVQLQRLDLLIVLEATNAPMPPLPDGFAPLAPHNLSTFKSFREPLDAWAILELIAHYVSYRKFIGYETTTAADFRLYAVCARRPTQLFGSDHLVERSPGVYTLTVLGLEITVIVIAWLPQTPNNAMLHLFSADEELIAYGQTHYRPRETTTSSLLFDLFREYRGEGIPVPITLEEYTAQVNRKLIKLAPIEDRLEGLTPEQRLAGLLPEQVAQQLTPEQRLAGLAPEERLAGLTPEQLAVLSELAERKRAAATNRPAQ